MISLLIVLVGLARADFCFPITCTATPTGSTTATMTTSGTSTATPTPTGSTTATATGNPTGFSVGSQITSVAGVAAAGIGSAFIVASGTAMAATTAVASVCTIAAPAAGSYRINATVNVTAWTTPASFNVQVTYTDDGGSARTSNIAMKPTTGTLPAGGNITATGVWEGQSDAIGCNAAAITVLTAGTFTGSPTYNVYGSIERLR